MVQERRADIDLPKRCTHHLQILKLVNTETLTKLNHMLQYWRDHEELQEILQVVTVDQLKKESTYTLQLRRRFLSVDNHKIHKNSAKSSSKLVILIMLPRFCHAFATPLPRLCHAFDTPLTRWAPGA